MKTRKAIEILELHNRWRRRDTDSEMLPPKQIGEAIDTIIESHRRNTYMLNSYKLALAPACLFIGVVVGMLIVILMK